MTKKDIKELFSNLSTHTTTSTEVSETLTLEILNEAIDKLNRKPITLSKEWCKATSYGIKIDPRMLGPIHNTGV